VSRLATEGLVFTGGDSLRVSGTSWLDREWSTSLLSEDQTGWDWFSIQLDTGHDLMYFQLRGQEEGAVSFVDGALVDPAGVRLPLDPETLSVRVTDTWRSARSGATYPSGWVIEGADPALSLVLTPVLRDQELDVSVRYWEGAVDVAGEYGGRRVAGRGFVELTGY
jgi:predicted secreted hydrolase